MSPFWLKGNALEWTRSDDISVVFFRTPEEQAARKLKRNMSTAQSSKKFRQKLKEIGVKHKMLSVHEMRKLGERVRPIITGGTSRKYVNVTRGRDLDQC